MIKEIQGEVQAKVNEQVVSMLHTFLGDVGLLLRHLLKGGNSGQQNNERTMETARVLQVLHQFDLGNSESGYDSDSDSDSESESDNEQSENSEKGNGTRTGKGRDRGLNPQHKNVCQCGKAVRQYQRSRKCIEH